jgi:outer membrane protein TolC
MRKTLFASALFLFCLQGIFSRTITLDEAVSLALEQNLDIQKKRIDTADALYAKKHLWAELFPGIRAGAGASYASTLFTGKGFQLEKANGSLSVSARLALDLNAGIPHSMKIIRLAYEGRLLDYEDARRQLEITTVKNFYTLLADRENLANFEGTLELAERQMEKDRIAFNNGLKGELDFLQSRLGVETAKFNLSRVQADYSDNLGEFLRLLGLPPNEQVDLDGKIAIVRVERDAAKLIAEYLPGRPDIIRYRHEIERLEYEAKQKTLSAKAPALNLSAEWSGRGSADFTDSVSAGAALSIPLDPWIPGTKTDQSLKIAHSAVEKAKLDLRDAELSAAARIRSLTAGLRNSWDSVEIARLRVELAERTYQLNEQGFQMGAVESLTLEDTRNALALARQELLASELDYELMTLDLVSALNINWKDILRKTP